MAYNWSRVISSLGFADLRSTGTADFALDSAFVYETSDDVWFVRFVSPVTQTNAALTLNVYCVSVVGSPTDVRMSVYNGPGLADDKDRPEAGGAALATSGAVDFSATGGTWVTLSVASVSLVVNQTYYVLLDNRTASPASHYPTVRYKGVSAFQADSSVGGSLLNCFRTGTSTDGFATDPSLLAPYSPSAVVTFGDGSLVGNPYVVNESHAANTNYRGCRFLFTEDVVLSGAVMSGASGGTWAFHIHETDGTSILTTANLGQYNRQFGLLSRFVPQTLTGGTSYDLTFKVTTNSSLGALRYMGEASGSLPADVLACRPGSISYVDGATPGSFAVDTARMMAMGLIFDDNPAIAGGAGGLLTHPGMAGGMRG